MIQKLNLQLPLNTVSFGQVSFNILRELYRRKIQCVLFPRGGNLDLSAYKIDQAFGSWIERSVNSRYSKLDRSVPTLNLWHIQGSEARISDKQVTFSFHETDSPTDNEVNIVNQQDLTLFTSTWTVDNFKTYGAKNVDFVPLGLDEDFTVSPRRGPEEVVHWICVGKWEDLRKLTTTKIQLWIKMYGGNMKHQLTLCVNNPFLKPEDMNYLYNRAFNGSKPANVNVLPHLKTNAEMSALYNSADIDISGISRSEGWNIPAHTATCLGKWSVVTNVTAHKDWATDKNAILVEPSGTIQAHDGVFFHKGAPFSQGNIFDFSIESLESAYKTAEVLANTTNTEGLLLGKKQTYKNTVDQILEKIEKI